MPELPEVETVRRGLAPYFVGRRIERVTLRRDGLRFPFPEDMGQVLTGRRVLDLGRRAKFLLFELEGGAVLIAHLGMSGRFRVFDSERPPLDKHDHVVFELSGGHQVRYNDPRRFGLMDLVTDGRACEHPMLASLGPEPVFPALTGAQLAKRLAGRQGPIKSALLDQGVIAGVGNIYACEALFDSGISPRRRGRTVAGRRAERLAKAIGDVLEAAIEAGGSSLRDHRQPSGELGYFQHAFKVYGREGAACPRCGGGHAIKWIVQSGRSTFFCSACQR